MHELTTTRHNEMIEPYLHVWTWQIPVYLFLGGLVAGLMIISGYLLISNKYKEKNSVAPWLPLISLVSLSLGMFALFLDLEHKLYVWRLYTTFKITSPMSWGSWILVLIYPALVLNVLINPPLWLINKIPALAKLSGMLKEKEKNFKFTGMVNVILGALVGTYTGVLLSTLGARPLWSSSVLWLLFLVSGLSSASALVHMISQNRNEQVMLAKADNTLLLSELFIILMMIIGLLSSSEAHILAAKLILTGPYGASFWVLLVGLGILVPLFLQSLAIKDKIKHTLIPPVLVLIGGFVLRIIIVYAGQHSHYLNAHFK